MPGSACCHHCMTETPDDIKRVSISVLELQSEHFEQFWWNTFSSLIKRFFIICWFHLCLHIGVRAWKSEKFQSNYWWLLPFQVEWLPYIFQYAIVFDHECCFEFYSIHCRFEFYQTNSSSWRSLQMLNFSVTKMQTKFILVIPDLF